MARARLQLALVLCTVAHVVLASRPLQGSGRSLLQGSDEIFCAEAGLGEFANVNTDCQTYYQCYASLSNQKRCPDGTLFDQPSQRCTEASKVACGGIQVAAPAPAPLQTALAEPGIADTAGAAIVQTQSATLGG